MWSLDALELPLLAVVFPDLWYIKCPGVYIHE